MIGQTLLGQGIPQQFAEAPLHPVAHHCIADSLGNGNPIALAEPSVRTGQQNKTRPRNADARICREEISALGNDGWFGRRCGHDNEDSAKRRESLLFVWPQALGGVFCFGPSAAGWNASAFLGYLA